MIATEVRKVRALLASTFFLFSFTAIADDSIILPLPEGTFDVGQSIGAPRSGGRKHQGIDLMAAEGTPVLAIADGVVTDNGTGPRQGYAIRLEHNGGVTTFYAHLMARSDLSEGDVVRQGDIIGYVGETGNARSPHLHFELRKNSKILDPLDYFDEL